VPSIRETGPEGHYTVNLIFSLC